MRVSRAGALLFGVVQGVLAVSVLRRLALPAHGPPITRPAESGEAGSVSVIVPVLNEVARLGPCLDGLLVQDQTVGEILVVDGGSDDGTQQLVMGFSARDRRVRQIDASPVPPDWNGKAWGLQVGLEQANTAARWLLTVDADVRPQAGLVSGLVAQAASDGVVTASVATRQELGGLALGLLHPSCLTTLVYRLGRPGRIARRPAEVQANGQCQLFERAPLLRVDGFRPVRGSRCEDVTIARTLAAAGGSAGFYESAGEPSGDAGGLVSVRMYEHWREAWDGWTRSLPLRDQYTGWWSLLGLAEVTLVQALPLPLAGWLAVCGGSRALLALNVLLVGVRFGVLAGTRPAYEAPPWTYWLSPLVDLPVAVRLWASVLQKRHTWRGRPLVTGVHS